MSTPEIVTIPSSKPRQEPNQLFINRATGEYCIKVQRPGTCCKWVSLDTTDRLTALRRLKATGVEKILEVAGDAKFTEAIVETLTAGERRPLEDVIDQFLADLQLRNQTSSMAHPRVICGQFLRLFAPRTCITTISPQRIGAWINTAPSLTRRQRRLSVLEGLFQFAFDQGYRKDNPAKRVGLKLDDLTFDQMERTIKTPFTEAEFQMLLDCDKVPDFWKVSAQLAWWLGLRMSDCCCLQWGSFCAVPGKLVTWQVKTRKRVEHDLSDPVLGGGILIPLFDRLKETPEDAVFVFPGWQQIYRSTNQPQTVHDFRYWCMEAGLDGSKTFSSFRKSAAQRWEDAGRNIKEIGMMLGHESTGNSAFYLERPTK